MAEQWTPGPWRACHEGECKCGQVWTADHPVATVIRGEWGDEYPTIVVEGPSLERVARATMERISYGSVPEDQATANARLIAAAPDLLSALEAIMGYAYQGARISDVDTNEQPEFVKARAAIAKAKGEQA